jgi:hypothetical protein
MKHFIKLCTAVAALATLPQAAQAQSGANAGFGVRLTVPEICHLVLNDAVVAPGEGAAVIDVFEMCNSGRGFRVIASHRPLETGEQVQVNYAGQIRLLDSSGMSDIAYRNGPIFGSVPVTIQTSGLVQGLAISLGFAVI